MASWKRVYWSVWLANLITSVGMMSFLPFFPTHLRGLGLTDPAAIAAWTGVIFGAAPLMAALMGPVWGSLGDRVGRKAMVLRALFAIAFFVGCMAFVRTPLEMLGLRLMQGVFSGFVAPSITLVSVVAPPEAQGRVTGSLQTALAVGTIAGPLLGAFVEAELGLAALFLVVSGAALASALVVLVLVREPARPAAPRVPEAPASEPPARALAGLFGDIGAGLRDPALRSVLVIVFGVQLAMGSTQPLLELFVGDVWAGDPALVPTLTAGLFSVLAVCDLLLMPRWGGLGDRSGHRVVLERCMLGTGVALALHAAAPGFAVVVLARVMLGVVQAGVKPSSFGLTAELTPLERRGSAIGMLLSARQLGLSLSAAVGGLLAGVLGLRGLFLLGGLALVLFAWFVGRGRSRRDAAPSEPAAVSAARR